MNFHKRVVIGGGIAMLALLPASLLAQDAHIGSVRTEFKLLGPNNTIEVERFDDPKVQGISCYLSYSQIGGISGAVGLAEEASEAVRMHDSETQTFVYLTYSTKLVDGSPKNAISAVNYGDF